MNALRWREGARTQPYTWHVERSEWSAHGLPRTNSEPCIVEGSTVKDEAVTNAPHVALNMEPLVTFAPSIALPTRRYAVVGARQPKYTRLPTATLNRNLDTSTTRASTPKKSFVDDVGLGALLDNGAPWVLAGVTVLWGSQHAVMKQAVMDGATPGGLTATRFAIAAILLSPWLRSINRREILAGLELGAWSFAGFALQTLGLETTTAARSCFLLYLNVKMVPLIGLLTGRSPPWTAWLAACVALGGTYLLAGDSGMHWVLGDTLSVAAAAASAMFIVRLGSFATSCRPAPLSAATVAVTALLGAVWAFGTGEGQITTEMLPAALYLGAIPTALATVLQARAQRVVRPDRAAVIYALDPVYGALFAHWLLGEAFGAQGVAGAALIVLAAFVSNAATNSNSSDRTKTEERDEVR